MISGVRPDSGLNVVQTRRYIPQGPSKPNVPASGIPLFQVSHMLVFLGL